MVSKETKLQIREIFPVRQKILTGDTVQDILDNIKCFRPDLASRVDAVTALLKKMGIEGVLEKGSSFTSAAEIFDYFKHEMKGKMQEEFWLVILDNKHTIVDKLLITKGTLNQTLIHPREVFSPAIEKRAAAIILVHNHPSGDPVPSNQDIAITQRLHDVGELVGIKVLDHVIIGNNKFKSFVNDSLMPS